MASAPAVTLIVSIDVEEDRWGISGHDNGLENIRRIPELQAFFDLYGVRPSYLVTYPIASCDWAVDTLAPIQAAGRCEIGAHLHPWNTPPVEEEINERNSMMLNLPYDLQEKKLRALTERIESAVGRRPRSFRAGRWALGPETVKALLACGYLVDTSVSPLMSWADDHGPDFTDWGQGPEWIGDGGGTAAGGCPPAILEIPVTVGFNRWPFDFWQKVSSLLQRRPLSVFHPLGLLRRSGLLRKIWLSPEGCTASDMIALTKVLLDHGSCLLNLSFHSNTLLPGKTPFVRTESDREFFFAQLGGFFEFLSARTSLSCMTLAEVAGSFPKGEVRPPPGAGRAAPFSQPRSGVSEVNVL